MYYKFYNTRLTMKKFLSICLAALMIASAVSVAAFAAASDWTKGNGFHIVEQPGDKTTRTVVEENSPVTLTDNADGTIHVSHGGWFQGADNWGGVTSNNTYDLNGLEVEVKFDKVPEVTADTDCWIAIDFLKNSGPFNTDVTKNPGFMTLIRFGKPFLQIMDGVSNFNPAYDSQILDDNSVFAIKSGDTFKVKAERNSVGTYDFTFTNGDKSLKVPATEILNATDFAALFEDGMAYVTVMASAINSHKDDFQYNIKVSNGSQTTEEDKQAIADALAEAERQEAERLAKEQAELDAMLNGETVEDPADEQPKDETPADDEQPADEQPADDNNDDKDAEPTVNNNVVDNTEEEGGSNVGLIVGIIAAIVVIAIVVIIILKKKGAKK